MGDVVAAVADEGETAPDGVAERLLDGQQVGQGLAGMVLVGERVHDRNCRPPRQLIDCLLGERANHDRRHVPRQRAGGVGDRLASPQLQLLWRQRHRRRAEACNCRGERDACACRRLLEDAGDRLAAKGILAVGCVALHRRGEVEQFAQLLGCQVGNASEVAREGVGARSAHPLAHPVVVVLIAITPSRPSRDEQPSPV